MTKGWLKLEKQLLKVVLVKNTMTGEEVKWSHTHTLLFLYMNDRYSHFKRQGGEFFDNQENIAVETGISLAVVKRRLKDFYRLGVMRTEKKKLTGFVFSNSYTVLDIFTAPMFEAITSEGEILEKFSEAHAPIKAPMKSVSANIVEPEVLRNKWGIGEIDPDVPF